MIKFNVKIDYKIDIKMGSKNWSKFNSYFLFYRDSIYQSKLFLIVRDPTVLNIIFKLKSYAKFIYNIIFKMVMGLKFILTQFVIKYFIKKRYRDEIG
jgi:hypothetical protein